MILHCTNNREVSQLVDNSGMTPSLESRQPLPTHLFPGAEKSAQKCPKFKGSPSLSDVGSDRLVYRFLNFDALFEVSWPNLSFPLLIPAPLTYPSSTLPQFPTSKFPIAYHPIRHYKKNRNFETLRNLSFRTDDQKL